GLGAREALRRGTFFLQAAMVALALNLLFYGFFFYPWMSYMYCLYFLFLYVLLIVLGSDVIYRKAASPVWKYAWLAVFTAMVAAAVADSLYTLNTLDAMAIKK